MITAFGLSCGLFVIFRVTVVAEPSYEFFRQMTIILMIAGIADVLDGAIARAIQAESEFGILFDSLSDAVTFGVAPSILFLKTLPTAFSTGVFSLLALSAAILYTICGILRLVRFSIKAAIAQEKTTTKKTFIGLPIPAAAAAAFSPSLLIQSPLFQSWVTLSPTVKLLLPTFGMFLVANLMVSKFRFPSVKNAHFRVPSFHLIFFTTIMAILVIYGVLYYLPLFLIIISWVYVLLGCVLSIARLIAGRKSKRLADFQPIDEDDDGP